MATSKIDRGLKILKLSPAISAITTDSYSVTVPYGITISGAKSIIPVVSTGTSSRANVFIPVVVDASSTQCVIKLWSLGGSVTSAQPSLNVYVIY